MILDWQTVTALLCVTAAAGYVVVRTWRAIKAPQRGCGSCDSDVKDGVRTKPLVTLEDADP